MRTLIILSLAITASLAIPAADIDPFIVGGVNAIPGEFPFMASINWIILGLTQHVCGAVILNNIWVLTAAHCLTETPTTGRLTVHVGAHNLGLAEATRIVHEIDRPRSIIHPDWIAGPQVGPDDMALIRLVIPLTFNARIRPVRLPVHNAVAQGPATLAGWGSTTPGGTAATNILQKTIKPIITIQSCRDAINAGGLDGSRVDYTNLCTGPVTGGMSACAGDSGGPLVQGAEPNQVLVGIVSWGITPCGRAGFPSGIYKNVAVYIPWISANTGIIP